MCKIGYPNRGPSKELLKSNQTVKGRINHVLSKTIAFEVLFVFQSFRQSTGNFTTEIAKWFDQNRLSLLVLFILQSNANKSNRVYSNLETAIRMLSEGGYDEKQWVE